MKANPDNPATLLYWNDLEGEPGLQYCGLAGYGLWLKMLGLAARSREYGVVLIGDHPSLRQDLPMLLAAACGESAEAIEKMIDKLIVFRVASVDAAGRVYNRRMVEEARLSTVRAVAGRKGADATNTGRQKSGKQGGKASGNGSGKIDDDQKPQNASQSTLNGHGQCEGRRQIDGNTIGKSSASSVFQSFSLSSEPNGSGAAAPPAGSNETRKKLFGQGVDWLQSVTGKPNAPCRALMGRWRKDLGDDAALLDLLAEAQRQEIQGPESWFAAAIRERKQRAGQHEPPRTVDEARARRDCDPAWQGVQ